MLVIVLKKVLDSINANGMYQKDSVVELCFRFIVHCKLKLKMGEIPTSNLDAKLISNLGYAYEVQELLKDDEFILPQFHISISSEANSNTNKVKNLLSTKLLHTIYIIFSSF
jgi:hypothetical protein